MSLTPSQLTTWKADIETNPDVAADLAAGNLRAISDYYNGDASPDYWIYRSSVPADEVRLSIDAQDIADITEADRGRCVDLLALRADVGFSGGDARDRSAWDDIFSAANGDNSQQAIALLWARLASRVEKLLATGANTGASRALADTAGFEGTVSPSAVRLALES